jgi:hypothetical protein
MPKGNDQILRIGVVASSQKLGLILQNKGFFEVTKKNFNNVLLNLYPTLKKN